MKRLSVLLATTAALAAGPALAGGIAAAPAEPVVVPEAAPLAPAGPDWTGFYAGGQFGYASVDTSLPGIDGDDAIGGLTLGYDYDFGQYVLGAGIDYDWADINIGGVADLENVLRLKLRGGYKFGNGLAYLAGGYAEADTDTLGSDDGYFIGAGYEHLVNENFSVGGEVLYHEFDNFGPTTVDVDATTVQIRGTFRF